MQSLEDVQEMLGKEVRVVVPTFYCHALEEVQEEKDIVGTLIFAGMNNLLGSFKQVTVGRTPVRVKSWDDVKLYTDNSTR